MDDLEQLQLESQRLALVPLSLAYKDEIFQELTSEIVMYMYPRSPSHIRETEQFIHHARRQQQLGIHLTFIILQKLDQTFIGVCGLNNIDTPTPSLGIWTKKAAHGQGFGREAIACLKQWMDNHMDYRYLVYPVDRRNIPSRKIPEHLGGRIRREYQQLNLSGLLLDVLEYHIYP